MKLRRFPRLLFVIMLVLSAFPALAHAGLSAPNSSANFTADHSTVLIMRSSYPVDDGTPNVTLPNGRTLFIPAYFSKSGLYDVSTLAPIWQVDWFSLDRRLRWSSDFRYVVRINIHAFDHDWALRIYDRGKLVQTINCADLLQHFRSRWVLPYATWDWWIVWFDDVTIHDGRLYISTPRRSLACFPRLDLGYQEHYEFDLATGALLSSRTTGTWILGSYLIAILFLLTGIGLLSIYLWRFHRLAFLRFLPRATIASIAAAVLGVWPAFAPIWSYEHTVLMRDATTVGLTIVISWLVLSRRKTPWLAAAVWLWPELIITQFVFESGLAFVEHSSLSEFAANLLIFGGTNLAAATLFLSFLQRFRPPQLGPHCPQCHYCLIGTSEDRCPECGRSFNLSELRITRAELQPPA